jgi:mercuric ion binding protein
MKSKALTIALFTLFIFPSAAWAEEITITVKGMVCSFCAQGIKKTFKQNENVKDIQVDLDKKLVHIETKDGTTISDEALRQTITDSGYDVVSIVRGKNV